MTDCVNYPLLNVIHKPERVKPTTPLWGAAIYINLSILQILKNVVRESNNGQYLGTSHLSPFFPTFCDCNTLIKIFGLFGLKTKINYCYDILVQKKILNYLLL